MFGQDAPAKRQDRETAKPGRGQVDGCETPTCLEESRGG